MSSDLSAPRLSVRAMPLDSWVSALRFSRWTIRSRITALVLALLLPLNLTVFAVIWHLAESASETQRRSLLYTATSVAAAVDAKLGEHVNLAQVLARSPALLSDNLDAFEAEARRTFLSIENGWVVVANLEGQQLINTARPKGQPLPMIRKRKVEDDYGRSNTAYCGDLVTGASGIELYRGQAQG